MKVFVTDRKGTEHELDATADRPLMETLRKLDWGVAAICGGVMACGTCHVYVAESDLALLPAQSEDELALLEGLLNIKPNSRLSCQIPMVPALEGLRVTLAPEE